VAREPRPYKKGKFWVTSAGGSQHHKLCPLAEGFREAKRQLRLYLAQLAELGGPATVPGTLEARVAEWLSGRRPEVTPDTFRGYGEKVKPLVNRLGARRLYELTEADGLSYKQWLMTEAPRARFKTAGRGLANQTVNHHVRVARQFLNWCTSPRRRYLPNNPWAEISYLPTKPRQRLVTPEEFGHLYEQAKPDVKDLLFVLYHTTFRPQEVRALRWDYIHWDRNRAIIPATETKAKRPRVVTLSDGVLAVLGERRERLSRRGLKRYVFPCRRGDKKLSKNGLVVKFRTVLDRCVRLGLVERERGGETLCSYSLRHSRATRLLLAGVNLQTVSLEMGHAQVATTARHYLHLTNDDVVNEVLRKVG
jgi:integrase